MISDDDGSDSTLAQASRGFRATLLSQAVRVGCKAVSVVVLARVVAPVEHGVFAMAASLFYLLVLFRDLGLGTAAVQARELSEEQCSTLWRAHAILGVGLAITALALAPATAALYGEPRVRPLLAVMSACLLVIGLNAWPRALLTRELRFAELNRLETLAAVVGTVAMLVAGASGAGAYTFAIFLFVSESIMLVGAWRVCRWRPRAPARWGSLDGLSRAGLLLTGHNVLLCVLQQVDTMLMGRWFGATALGFYNRPGQVLALPTQHVSAPLTQVLMASLSRLGPTSPDFARHVRESANLIAHLTLPLAAVCVALPHETVRLLLGAAWPEAAPLLRWLALGAAATYLGATAYGLCIATGHTRRLVQISAVALAATLLGLWCGRPYGPHGLAAGVALANFALLAPRLWWAARGTPVRLRDFGAAFVGPVGLSAGFVGGALAGCALAGESAWMGRFAAGIGGGALVGVLLASIWPQLRAELRHVWQHRPGARQT